MVLDYIRLSFDISFTTRRNMWASLFFNGQRFHPLSNVGRHNFAHNLVSKWPTLVFTFKDVALCGSIFSNGVDFSFISAGDERTVEKLWQEGMLILFQTKPNLDFMSMLWQCNCWVSSRFFFAFFCEISRPSISLGTRQLIKILYNTIDDLADSTQQNTCQVSKLNSDSSGEFLKGSCLIVLTKNARILVHPTFCIRNPYVCDLGYKAVSGILQSRPHSRLQDRLKIQSEFFCPLSVAMEVFILLLS